MDAGSLKLELLRALRTRYPAIEIEVGPFERDPARLAIRFVEPSFAGLYQQQRYHKLVHLIPRELYEQELSNTVWFELAPGERAEDLPHVDDDLIRDISPKVMGVLAGNGAFERLGERIAPKHPGSAPQACAGDFQYMRRILVEMGFDEEAQFDVFLVLMSQGAFCDCEILFNVVGKAPDRGPAPELDDP